MRKLSTIGFFLLVATTSGGATECGQVITDPGFDAWCGDLLCNWDVLVEDEGGIERAATWHSKDLGVSLLGDVQLHQATQVEASDGRCIAFSLIADFGADASIILKVDANNDYSPEWEQILPASSWRPLAYRVRMPEQYKGAMFVVRKIGGRAVVANIEAQIAPEEECAGLATGQGASVPGL
jgi:hypothetical protein